MEYKQNKVLHVLNPDLLIKRIEVADRTFVVDVYQLKDKPKFGFFVRLDSGRITLMSKMIVGMTEFEGARALQDPKPAQYIRQPDTYYYKIDDGPLIKIGNIRKLIESLPDHKKEMEEFSKIEKISAKKPEGLTKFIQHYNSLK